MTSTMTKSYGLAGLLLLLALPLAACGGAPGDGVATAGGASTSPPAPAGGTDGEGDGEGDMLKFAQCMREHGVPMDDPDPESGTVEITGGDVDQETMQEAQEACQEHLGSPRGRAADDPQMRDQMLKFARCMREHGIDMPDPDFSGDGPGGVRISRDDVDSPEFREAQEACEKYIPGANRSRTNR